MLDAIKAFFESKKWLGVFLGAGVTALMGYLEFDPELIAIVAGLFGTGVVGQGIADNGKEAEKLKQAAEKQ